MRFRSLLCVTAGLFLLFVLVMAAMLLVTRGPNLQALEEETRELRPSAIPKLVKLLESSSSQHLGYALSKLEEYGVFAGEALPHLRQLLQRTSISHPHFQMEIAIVLLSIHPQEEIALARVESLLAADVAKADQRLGQYRIAPDRVVPLLAKGLEHADADVRARIAYTLGEYRREASAAARALASRLVDEDPKVRLHAAQALGDIGSAEASLPLLRCLHDDDEGVAVAALQSLHRIGAVTPEIARALFGVLDSRRPNVRSFAMVAILTLKIAKVDVRKLVEVFLSEDKINTKRHILSALSDVGDEKDFGFMMIAISKALLDPEIGPRYGTDLLDRIGKAKKDVIPTLISLLTHRDKELRLMAIRSLGDHGSAAQSAIPALTALAESAEKQLRWEARNSLALTRKTSTER